MRRLFLLLFCAPVWAGPTLPIALNYDSTVNTEYRAGDKPVAGAACPTGWTCAAKGDGTEDIDEVSATSFLMVTSGTTDEGSIGYAYKSTATDDDIQVIARIPAIANWTGHLENATQCGVGITEGTDSADYASQVYWRYAGTAIQAKTDAGGAGEAQVSGLANQSLPRYVGIKYDDSATALSYWESSDAFEWFQVGTTVTKSLTFPALGYVYCTSHDPTATTTVTLTGIDFSNTLTIGESGGGGGGGANVAPVWNSTPIITGTAGTAKSITIANSSDTTDCTKRVCDDNGDALTLTEQGCTWPTGVTVNNTTDTVEIATNAVAGTTASCQIGASDGIEARVDSSAFSIVIDPAGGGEEDATLLWIGDFEGGSADIDGSGDAPYKTAVNGQGQLAVVTTGTGGCSAPRHGTYMGRATIPSGASGTPQRAEFREKPAENFEWDGTTYWIGGSLCYDSFATGQNTHVQIHASNEGPGECDMAGNGFGIHGSGTWEVIDNPSGISESSGANSNHITVYSSLFTSGANQDVWHDIVVKIKANTDHSGVEANCNGEYSMWHNGVLVASDNAACNVNYKDACGTVIQPPKNKWTGLSIGLYRSNTTPVVGYWDQWRMAEGENGYNTVDPAQDD